MEISFFTILTFVINYLKLTPYILRSLLGTCLLKCSLLKWQNLYNYYYLNILLISINLLIFNLKAKNLYSFFKLLYYVIILILIFYLLLFIDQIDYTESTLRYSSLSIIPYTGTSSKSVSSLKNLSLIPYSSGIKSIVLFNPDLSTYYRDLILVANKGYHFLDISNVWNYFPTHRQTINELLNNNSKKYLDLKKMDQKPKISCLNFMDLKEREAFKKKVQKKGGIYMIQYKYAPNILYLGRASNFNKRFTSHFWR